MVDKSTKMSYYKSIVRNKREVIMKFNSLLAGVAFITLTACNTTGSISNASTNKFDNSLVFSMEGPAKFFPVVLGFFVATSYLTIETQAAEFLETLNRSLITILIFWTFHQIIGPLSVVIKSIGDLISRDLVNWIIKAIKVLIFILGVAAVLELWGIKIGPIIAGLGLFGVAVALGAQDFFKKMSQKKCFMVKDTIQYFDKEHHQFLPDRFVTGECPKCGYENAYGDQCEACGSSLNVEDFIISNSCFFVSKSDIITSKL